MVWTLFLVNTCQPEGGGGRGIQRSYCYARLHKTLLLPVQVRSIDIHDRKLLTLARWILKQSATIINKQ